MEEFIDNFMEAVREDIADASNEVIRKYINLKKYKNEFETMKMFFSDDVLLFTRSSPVWNTIHNWNPPADQTKNSIRLREQGNKLFKASPKEHALDACRFYTKAIFAANLGSEALALAHANRAIALQEFGYYQQAYDDCECAIEQGYPMKLLPKILMRQAFCAQQLGKLTLLKGHLDTLEKFKLNKNLKTQLEQIQMGFQNLRISESDNVANEHHCSQFDKSIKITKRNSKEGYIVSQKYIQKDQLILTERATSFVAIEERLVCQQCAASQLIPFPCYRCHGNVIYCSSKCRVAHQAVHAYECIAYQKTLYPDDFTRHLPLRMLLDGLPQVLPMLSEQRSANEIWTELTNEKSKIMQKDHIEYTHTLRMKTELGKESMQTIMKMAQCANFLTGYLRKFTDFFNMFKNTKINLKDWEIIIASLILRHTGQLLYNCVKIITLDVKASGPLDFPLLSPKLWQSPFHIRRGLLHKMSNIQVVACGNFPILNRCKNTCSPSNLCKFSGRSCSLIANKNIKTGDEINKNYAGDSRIFRQVEREEYLKESFNIVCKCGECKSENPDKNYNYLRRFVCENPRCRQTYTPEINENDYSSIFELTYFIYCTKCQAHQQNFCKSLRNLFSILLVPDEKIMLSEPFKHYQLLDRWLLNPHRLKNAISLKLIEKCFAAYNAGANLSYNDFSQIAKLVKYNMQYYISFLHLKSLHYVSTMTHLWDLIALEKYQCKKEEMQEMLQALDITSDEVKNIYMNYYNDFIADLIKQ